VTSEARVLGFIHHTHAAASKLASYGIVRDGLPDYGFHDWQPGKDSSGKANTGQAMIRAARARAHGFTRVGLAMNANLISANS